MYVFAHAVHIALYYLYNLCVCAVSGSGTGYLTVCMALMVGVGQEGGGAAVGIDYIQGLVDLSRR